MKHKQRQANLKEQAKLHDDLARSLELRACLGKEIWTQGGSVCNPVTTTLWEVNPGYGQFLDRWQVELANAKEVVLPRTTLAKLKNDNNRLFHWVMKTSVMQKALTSSKLNTPEIRRLINEHK